MNSTIQTAWVKPPFETGGLDHLGAQAPCIQIYGQLLPGITNVTDRARYYSFYLWLFNEFEKRGWRTSEEVIDYLRKADCLFTLIAIRHGRLHGNYAVHAGAAVGSNALSHALTQLESQGSLRLSQYTHFNENDSTRYFLNRYGGLGQYYFGVLESLNLMSGSSVSSARLIKGPGTIIAEAMASGVPGDAFFAALESDEVNLALLDELSSFCHCQLTQSQEETALLVDVLREGWTAIAGESQEVASAEEQLATAARARSLSLLIQLAQVSADSGINFDVYSFRGMTYSLCAFNKQAIAISESLASVAGTWQVYQRNEVLSVAMQGLFFSMLRAVDLQIENTQTNFKTTRDISTWFWHQGPGSHVLENEKATSLLEFLTARCAALPEFSDWRNEHHEIQLIEKIVDQTDQASVSADSLMNLISLCLDALAAVCCRPENQQGYGNVQFRAGYLEPYPVNLNSVPNAVQQVFAESPLHDALVRFTAQYCLDSHLRVAMRKLRQQGQNTSRFELAEHGVVIKKIPPAAHTTPRFNQAIRILQDVGLLVSNEDTLAPSTTGLAFCEMVS